MSVDCGRFKLRKGELHEEGTFTQAAKRFGISEPALSKRLQMVERFVNVSLFERSYNGAQPMDSGRSFIAYAVESIYAFKRAVQEAQEIKHEKRPRLCIGVSAYLPPTLIDALHSIVMPLYRDLIIEIVTGRSMELLADLQQHRVDLALVSSPPQTPTITTVRVAARVVRLDQCQQFSPRHHNVHLIQKLLTPRLPCEPLKLCLLGPTHLPHLSFASINRINQ